MVIYVKEFHRIHLPTKAKDTFEFNAVHATEAYSYFLKDTGLQRSVALELVNKWNGFLCDGEVLYHYWI